MKRSIAQLFYYFNHFNGTVHNDVTENKFAVYCIFHVLLFLLQQLAVLF